MKIITLINNFNETLQNNLNYLKLKEKFETSEIILLILL